MPTLTPTRGAIPTRAFNPITITIVYDNNPFDTRLKTAWGFACLVETGKTTVLFDTGGDGALLLSNLATLGFDPRRIDAVILSHYHNDHTGGLDAVLAFNDRVTVLMPRSFPNDFKARVSRRASVVQVSDPFTLAENIRTTGEVGTSIIEQSLIVETSRGLIVITGCAHPGIVEIAQQASAYGDAYMIVGGFHLRDKSVGKVESVIAELRRLGVQKVAPCHCTGEQALGLFKAEFGAGFIPAGVGAVIRE